MDGNWTITLTSDPVMLGMASGMVAAAGIIGTVLTVFLIVCQWRVFVKIGQPGWKCIIPIYSGYVLTDTAWSHQMAIIQLICSLGGFVIQVIPLVGQLVGFIALIASVVIGIITQYKLLTGLQKPTWWIVFVFICLPVFWALLAFSKEEE